MSEHRHLESASLEIRFKRAYVIYSAVYRCIGRRNRGGTGCIENSTIVNVGLRLQWVEVTASTCIMTRLQPCNAARKLATRCTLPIGTLFRRVRYTSVAARFTTPPLPTPPSLPYIAATVVTTVVQSPPASPVAISIHPTMLGRYVFRTWHAILTDFFPIRSNFTSVNNPSEWIGSCNTLQLCLRVNFFFPFSVFIPFVDIGTASNRIRMYKWKFPRIDI